MKQIAALVLCLCALFSAAAAESVSFGNMTVDSNAKYIDFGETQVTDMEGLVAFLDQLPQLEKVDMYESRLKDDQMEMLFERYPDIFFGWTFKIAEHVLRTDMTAFSTLHNKNDRTHSSAMFEKLKYCRNLQAIDLGHNAVKSIDFLRHFPGLKVLIIGRNQVSDISVLGELKEMEYMELFSNQITDISALAGLTKLKDLNLVNNRIRNIGVVNEIKSLERLWISMNGRVTKEDVDAIRQNLPDCEVDDYSHPTGGTWREHPHYDVIVEMFATGCYIPFE